MLKFTKQGTALIANAPHLLNEFEIQESETNTFSLRVNGTIIYFFNTKEAAIKVANLIEKDTSI